MHEQRALWWANNRGDSVVTPRRRLAHHERVTWSVRKLITKKSPAQFVRNPVTQRWHLGNNCSGCLLRVRARAQRCQGRGRACECNALREIHLHFFNNINQKTHIFHLSRLSPPRYYYYYFPLLQNCTCRIFVISYREQTWCKSNISTYLKLIRKKKSNQAAALYSVLGLRATCLWSWRDVFQEGKLSASGQKQMQSL